MPTPVDTRARETRTDDPGTTEFKAARRRYRLDKRISAGRIASVWRGRDAVTGTDVVVKRLESGSARDPVARRRLEEEAAVGGRVTHPNAVPVLDSIFDRREAAIVFPYLPGRTLAERLRDDGPLEPRAAVPIALDLADVLAAAHASGVVHRDIKPGNILLADDGTTRLLDFGISQAVDQPASDESGEQGESRDELTGSGMAIGTLPYMAPEQLTGGRPTPAADVYALGVVLYEMLSGRRPFGGRSPSEQLALQAEPPAPMDAPAALTQVVLSALDPVPERRPDATQVGRALGAWLDNRTETEAPTAPVALVAPSSAARRFKPATLAGVAVLALALLIVAGLALAGGGLPPTDSGQPTDIAAVAAAPSSSPTPTPTPTPTSSTQTPAPAPAGDGQANQGGGGGGGHAGGKHKGHRKHHHGHHGHHKHH